MAPKKRYLVRTAKPRSLRLKVNPPFVVAPSALVGLIPGAVSPSTQIATNMIGVHQLEGVQAVMNRDGIDVIVNAHLGKVRGPHDRPHVTSPSAPIHVPVTVVIDAEPIALRTTLNLRTSAMTCGLPRVSPRFIAWRHAEAGREPAAAGRLTPGSLT